jgi:hypothetical protein
VDRRQRARQLEERPVRRCPRRRHAARPERGGGFIGAGLVNGFNDFDWPVGTVESPTFTIDDPFVNLLVGGGNHPHVDGTQLGNEPPAGRLLFDGFEFPDGTTLVDTGWTATGDLAVDPSRNPSTAGGDYYLGQKRINTWEGGPKGDDNLGDLTSPAFTIQPARTTSRSSSAAASGSTARSRCGSSSTARSCARPPAPRRRAQLAVVGRLGVRRP